MQARYYSIIQFISVAVVGIVFVVAVSAIYISFGGMYVFPKIPTPSQVSIASSTTASTTESTTALSLSQEKIYHLTFGGDVMLARHVQVLQERSSTTTSAWTEIADLFSQSDVAVVNLEAPFSPTGPYPTQGFVFKTKPIYIDGLKFAGIDVVVLANNHFGNAGRLGMEYTFELLEKNGIAYVGAGRTRDAAYAGVVVTRGEKRFGFVAQVYAAAGSGATINQPGVALFDLEYLQAAIEQLRGQDVDLIIAQFHGGREYVREPNDEQIAFAHAAIDAGADMVIGHHPHWVQNVEQYKGKYIFYSLGNLIFDQDWSIPTTQGLVVTASLAPYDTLTYDAQPIVIENNFQPRLADTVEREEILSQIDIVLPVASSTATASSSVSN